MSLARIQRVNIDKVNIVNTATGNPVVCLRLSPLGNSDLHKRYVDNVVDVVDRFISYHNSPNCIVSIRNTVFSSICTVANGNSTNIVIKATGAIAAVVYPYGGNSLFDLSLINGVAYASEVYLSAIERFRRLQASKKVMENRPQTVHNLMRR